MQNLEEEIKKIKEKRSKMEMSEEGKEKIRKIIEDRNTRSENEIIKYVPKKNKTYIFAQKIAAVFICCLVLSSCAFAGEWKDILTKIFYGQGANIEYAVDNGYVQNIDMDYVESNGIKIKADYFYLDDYYMYIALDVVAEEEFDAIYLDKFEIIDENNNNVFYNVDMEEKLFFQLEVKRMSKKRAILLGKFSKIQDRFDNYSNLKIDINKIQLLNNDKENYIYGMWNLNTKIDDNIIFNEEEINYYVDSKEFVENYEINYKNHILNVNIKFKEEYVKKLNINDSKIYLEDRNGKSYNIGETSKIKYNEIITNFIVDNDFYKDNFKVKIENSNEKFIFYLKRNGS